MNEKEFYIYLGIHYQDRLRIRFKKEKGHILDMILQYEASINDRWIPIVRYDCAHGFFHRDLLHPNGTEEKRVIEIPNLKFGFIFAKNDLEDRWEWYKEQYLKKLKDEK